MRVQLMHNIYYYKDKKQIAGAYLRYTKCDVKLWSDVILITSLVISATLRLRLLKLVLVRPDLAGR